MRKSKTCGECKLNGVDCRCEANEKACEEFEPKKLTLFDCITQSPEVLADRFLYFSYRRWRSSLLPGMKFWKYPEARAATVAKLKEVAE